MQSMFTLTGWTNPLKMTLGEFIEQFDNPGSIVLLEGKRAVLPEDESKLIALGNLLASATCHMLFRSGNAAGADYLFCSGVANVDPNRLQLISPYKGHRKKYSPGGKTISLDEVNLVAEPRIAD